MAIADPPNPKTHLHPRHRKQHLVPVNQHDGATPLGNAVCTHRLLPVAAAANRRGPHASTWQRRGRQPPARMSVNVVDEHQALHALKKVDPLPNSVMRAWIHVLPPGGCRDLNVQRPPPPHRLQQTARQHDHTTTPLDFCATTTVPRRCAVETTRSAKLHLLVSHKKIQQYICFLWRTS